MKKHYQHGFGVVEILLIIVLLGAVSFTFWQINKTDEKLADSTVNTEAASEQIIQNEPQGASSEYEDAKYGFKLSLSHPNNPDKFSKSENDEYEVSFENPESGDPGVITRTEVHVTPIDSDIAQSPEIGLVYDDLENKLIAVSSNQNVLDETVSAGNRTWLVHYSGHADVFYHEYAFIEGDSIYWIRFVYTNTTIDTVDKAEQLKVLESFTLKDQ